MPYSQPKTIAAISKFYAFLTTLPYIPSSALVYPPPTGWPSIDDDVFAPLGKTPEVLNLLRHLPYFEGGEWRITHDTTVLPYHAPEVGDLLKNGGSMENAGLKPFDSDEIAPHAVYLTGGGDIYATWLICDTVEGTITEYVPRGAPFSNGQPWRDFPTTPIEDFLDAWKIKYVELKLIPVPGGHHGSIVAAGAMKDEQLAELRTIYRTHGWPAEFRRDQCYEVLLDWNKQRVQKLARQMEKDAAERRLAKTTEKLRQAGI